MKTLFTKGFYIVSVIILFIGITLPAKAQYTRTNLETGGLYTALAKDGSNNLYVTRVASGAGGATYEVVKYTNGMGTPVSIHNGLTHETGDYPWGLAVTSTGNVYISTDFTSGGGSIIKLTLSGGIYTPSTFQTGRYFSALALDAADNLYTSEYDVAHSTYAVVKYSANSAPGTAGTNLYDNLKSGTGYAYPTGLAIAPNGDIYVADAFSNDPSITDGGRIVKLTAASAYAATNVSSGKYSAALALDGSGNLFSSENGGAGYQLVEYINGGGAGSPVYSPMHSNGIFYPWGIAIFPGGKVFAIDGDDGTNGGAVMQLAYIPPAISYASPQSYNAGVAITSLSPSNSGGPVGAPADSTSPLILGSGFNTPRGVAADAAGNIYVADYGNNAVKKIPFGGGAPVTIGSGFSHPYGVAVDAAGNVYVADYSNNAIKEIPFGGGAPVTLGSGFSVPTGVAVDAAGNVYVADFGHNAVKKIPFGGGAPVTLGTGFSGPISVALDASGNVYVSDYNNSAIKKIPVGGGTPVVLGSGFSHMVGVAVDASGNVFVGDNSNNAVKEIPVGGGSPIVIGSGFSRPNGVAADGLGNIYVADFNNNAIKQIKPVGGYYAGLFLPAGLTIDNATGIISGTPTVVNPATNYSVTAYNIGGSSTTTVNITVNIPLPSVSYSSPNTYTINTAIPLLSPTSSSVAAPAYSSSHAAVSSGFVTPSGVAIDAAGNIYVADVGNNTIKKIPVGGGSPVALGSGFNSAFGVAVDASGNVYVADYGNNAVKKIPFGGGAPTSIGSGFNGPAGVAVDAAGNVYVADFGNSAIKEIPVGGGAPVSLGSGFVSPFGVAVDGSGNVYVADIGNSTVKKIPAGGGTPVTLGSGFGLPYGVAVDGTGNVFVADYYNTSAVEIPGGSGTQINLSSGFTNPVGIGADGAGNVYVADYGNNELDEINPVGGFYIGPFLPAGLSFNNTTGTISGTPTVLSPPTNYTVTAYNQYGSKSAVVNIKVVPSAGLSALALSSGTLSPAFATGTISYTALVSNATTYVTLTPTTVDPAATIKVNGTTVTSGTATAHIPLAVGPNTITTIVTANDGITTKTYTVIVSRASTNAYLSHISLNPSSTLTSVSGPGYGNYTTSVPNTEASIKVIPTALDTTATIRVNGTITPSGTASASIPLAVGADTITMVVTAQDGVTTKTYYITVNRAASTNAGLANLTLSSGTLSPAFATGTLSYTALVSNATTFVTLTPTVIDPTATVKVNGTAVSSGTASAHIPLVVGPNTITTVVTAQDGTTTSTYTVTVSRTSTNAYLSNISLNPSSTLTSVSGPGYGNYTTSVPNSEASVQVTPTALDPTATITVNGAAVASGTASAAIPLSVGTNTITIVSTAQDGVTTKTYYIKVTRAASLSALALSSGTLSPVFAPGTVSYTVSVSNATTSVTVTPTTSDPMSTITVNGAAVSSGTASTGIPLTVGQNAITTIVTAPDGITTKTYTVTVTRAASTNAYLSHISLSPSTTLTTVTGPGYGNYTTSVPNTEASVQVTPTALDPTATITVNGATVASGTASAGIPLSVGANTITIISTAQDGITTKTYYITVTRAASMALVYNNNIIVNDPNNNQQLTDEIIVHQAVSPNGDGVNDVLTIDNIEKYPDNKLTLVDRNGENIYYTTGYDNANKVFDGHSNITGKLQQPGTYFFLLEYKVNGVNQNKTGYIILKY